MPIKLWGNEILLADGYGGGIAASETCCCTSSSSSGSSSGSSSSSSSGVSGGVSSSSGTSVSSSSSGGDECIGCTGTPPATITLTIAGVADHPAGCAGNCPTHFNDTFTLDLVQDCDITLSNPPSNVSCGYYYIDDHPCVSMKYIMFVWFGPGDRVSLEMQITAAQVVPCTDWTEGENKNYVYGTGDGTCTPGTVLLDDHLERTADFRSCTFVNATFSVTIV